MRIQIDALGHTWHLNITAATPETARATALKAAALLGIAPF